MPDQSGYVGGKWGYINTKGELVIEVKYIKAMPFKNGKAEVMAKNKWKKIKKPK